MHIKRLTLHTLKIFLLRLLLLTILLLGILAFFIATTPGVKLMFRISNLLLPGTLQTTALKGHLLKPLTMEQLTYQYKNQHIILNKLVFKWHFVSLHPFNIYIEALEVDTIKLKQTKTELSTLKFYGDIKTFTGSFHVGDNQVTLKGPLHGPWHIHADLSDLGSIDPSLQHLKSKLSADATIYNMQKAVLTAKLSPGYYQTPKGTIPERIDFEGASFKANLNPAALSIDGYAAINQAMSARLNLKLPHITLNQTPKPTQAILGHLALNVTSFDFLDEVNQLDDIDLIFQKPTGKLNARIDIANTLEQPKLTGNINLTEGKLVLPQLGITLYPMTLDLKTNGTTWESTGHIPSNQGEALTLTGSGTLTPSLTGSVVLSGHEVSIMNTPEYQIKASPNLMLSIHPDAYKLDGSILIPTARITPVSFIHTERLTHDVVYAEAEKEVPNPFNLTTNIALKLGDDVQINLKGIQGHVDGMLQIKQEPKQALTAMGELKLRKGRYEAYGQKLNIEQGELIFMGQQIDNPAIRVRATREFKQTNAQFSGSNQLFDFRSENLATPDLGNHTTVGITATGRVDSPKVKLFSDPPNLSEADILSMLLLGKPSSHANKSSGQFLLKAITAMHLNSGSKGVKMLKDLQKSTGIDLDVQNKSLGTESSDYTKTSVSVGKSITKRIYLKYNVGLFQENSSVFTLTYLLNKFLSIKVTASDIGNGIDVTYSHSD